jgi:hypothetical protein
VFIEMANTIKEEDSNKKNNKEDIKIDEVGGPKGKEPTSFNSKKDEWVVKGKVVDF